MGEGMQGTSLPVARSASAGRETAAVGTRNTRRSAARNCMLMNTIHEMLKVRLREVRKVHFFFMGTMLPSRNRTVTVIQIALNTPGAWASVCTLAQFVPLQMSEPWHVSKPERRTGCRGDRRVQG